MCDFEENILKLLMEDKQRLNQMFVTKDVDYLKSLHSGIESAKKKLAECEEKQCIARTFKENGIVPQTSLHYWANQKLAYYQCKKQG